MASLAVVLNTTKKLSNDEYSVSLRVIHNRQTKYYAFSTLLINQSYQWRCARKDWKPAEREDNGLGKFRKSVEAYKERNVILKEILDYALTLLDKYDKGRTLFDFTHFEADLKHKEQPQTSILIEDPTIAVKLQDYYTQHIKILDEQGRVGLSGLYYETQRILKKFKPEALLSDVNVRFLESFEYWMRNVRGNMDTTISVKMRNLQRVINQAIEDKLFKQEDYPFGEKKYSINKRLDSSTKKIAISLDKVTKLKQLDLEAV